MLSKHRRLQSALFAVAMAIAAGPSLAEPVTAIHDLAKQEQQPLLDTLRELVSIESGSGTGRPGEDRRLIAERLRSSVARSSVCRRRTLPDGRHAGEDRRMVRPSSRAPAQEVMLIAHMDTVYLRGMLKDQPFRIDGDKAYGLGIADDKHGVAPSCTPLLCSRSSASRTTAPSLC